MFSVGVLFILLATLRMGEALMKPQLLEQPAGLDDDSPLAISPVAYKQTTQAVFWAQCLCTVNLMLMIAIDLMIDGCAETPL